MAGWVQDEPGTALLPKPSGARDGFVVWIRATLERTETSPTHFMHATDHIESRLRLLPTSPRLSPVAWRYPALLRLGRSFQISFI